MSASEQKTLLLKEISDLLGFDDGADDLLHHILSIGSAVVSATFS
jgi:hypothetical protein